MSLTKVAMRYASAMFDVAESQENIGSVSKDLRMVKSAYEAAPELEAAMRNPIVPLSKKEAVIAAAFFDKVSGPTQTFLKFLGRKERLEILREVAEAFLELEKVHAGIVEATVETSAPLSPETLEMLKTTLARKYNKTFSISVVEKPELLGGFRLIIKDRVFDCSIKHQLEKLEETFSA